MIYKTLVGLKSDLSKPINTPEILSKDLKKTNNMEEKDDLSEDIDDSENESSEEEDVTENESKFVNSARPRNESPDSKKVIQLPFIIYLHMVI